MLNRTPLSAAIALGLIGIGIGYGIVSRPAAERDRAVLTQEPVAAGINGLGMLVARRLPAG